MSVEIKYTPIKWVSISKVNLEGLKLNKQMYDKIRFEA